MVKIHIRIYRSHDYDLIHILENYKFNFSKAVYCALSAYCKHDVFVIELPEKRNQPKKLRKNVVERTLYLNSESDKDIIQLFEDLPARSRNCFIKTILRIYLCVPYDKQGYYELFRRNRRTADAASFKRTEKEAAEENGIKIHSVEKAEPVPLLKNESWEPEPVEQQVESMNDPEDTTENETVDWSSSVSDLSATNETGDTGQESDEEDVTALFSSLLG